MLYYLERGERIRKMAQDILKWEVPEVENSKTAPFARFADGVVWVNRGNRAFDPYTKPEDALTLMGGFRDLDAYFVIEGPGDSPYTWSVSLCLNSGACIGTHAHNSLPFAICETIVGVPEADQIWIGENHEGSD